MIQNPPWRHQSQYFRAITYLIEMNISLRLPSSLNFETSFIINQYLVNSRLLPSSKFFVFICYSILVRCLLFSLCIFCYNFSDQNNRKLALYFFEQCVMCKLNIQFIVCAFEYVLHLKNPLVYMLADDCVL